MNFIESCNFAKLWFDMKFILRITHKKIEYAYLLNEKIDFVYPSVDVRACAVEIRTHNRRKLPRAGDTFFSHFTHSRSTSMRLSAEHKKPPDIVCMQSISFIHTHTVWKAEMKWNDVRQKERKKTDRCNIVLDDCLMCASVNGWAMRIMYEEFKSDVR